MGIYGIVTNALEKRMKWCAITRADTAYDVNFIYDQNLYSKLLASEVDKNIKELKGSIAYKGIVQGKAKIINTIDDMKKFEEGDILLSIQSSPSLMPAIIKCAAIVTDEGGIMCHASVISRELKKPCIIGTKFATKIFKDGDMVEVDADKGIVKVII
jgi:pyruvate,water dikinase